MAKNAGCRHFFFSDTSAEYDGFDDDEYGIYNVFANEEKGTGEQRKFTDEFKEMIYNFGFEWWYTEHFAMRLGYIYDEEGKIIPKVKRVDVAFHAQRAIQELSFDTFKSVKSLESHVTNSLVLPLPIDYVNYTKISCVDNAGIKKPPPGNPI